MTLYLITGPAGVGKSSVSKVLCEKLAKSVLIEGDDIYNLVQSSYISPWKEGNHLEYFWKNSLDLIKNSLDFGYDVVFNYILSQQNLEKIKATFPNVQIKLVCLLCDEKTLLFRDSLRPSDCQMKERCLVLLEGFKQKAFDERFILLAQDNLSIDDEAEIILRDTRFIL